jgi:hypothetical protein
MVSILHTMLFFQGPGQFMKVQFSSIIPVLVMSHNMRFNLVNWTLKILCLVNLSDSYYTIYCGMRAF